MPGDATPIVVAAKPTRDYLAALLDQERGDIGGRCGCRRPPGRGELDGARFAWRHPRAGILGKG